MYKQFPLRVVLSHPDTNPNGIPLVLFGLLGGLRCREGTLLQVQVTNPVAVYATRPKNTEKPAQW